ncbi:MAG: cytochrome c biogenesis protein CcdA [Treponema sp.]|jgi:cytochrome c-type biogenesis protein|nr:cytochrome c biogenesis protein CcdA [Treponema sp.]
MNGNLSVFLAFSAGVLSFLSPCVLPLIPSWLCIIGGSSMTSADPEQKPRPVAKTICFVLGFSAVFIIFSIIFSVTFILMGGVSKYITIAAGIIVIILGLNIIFDFISLLHFEKRFQLKNKPSGMIGSFIAGCAFGAGWTPCIGPVLTSILLLAGQSGGVLLAVIYLTFYSAGLGLPFILASFFFDIFIRLSKKFENYIPVIQRVSGVVLIVIGILIITGHFQLLSSITSSWHH